MYSGAQKETIRRFADRVTPQSWHIVLEPKDERIQAGILNVHLSLQGPEKQVYTDFWGSKCYPFEHKDGTIWYANRYGNVFHRHQVKPILGMIDGRMVFKDLKTLGVNRKGKVARLIVCLWPYLGDWKGTLIHELAHVAVYRYQAFRTKDYQDMTLLKNHWNIDLKSLIIKERLLREGHHGPSFQKAFITLGKRVIREFGAEIPYDDDLWKTLRYELEFLKRKKDAAV
ncbi:MAG: hypothetical protein ISS65_13645 [Desulfobacterales bacterium]|nr:hypothetical protein [Desulfobacterales bacterium]